LIISNAKTPWEAVANSVGSDIVKERQSYPLNFRQLEEIDTRTTAPFAMGYSTRYGGIINCQEMNLPDAMLTRADRSSNEEAWKVADFPIILDVATANRLACIGGQFQFRGPIGTAEMYWLKADSPPQLPQEEWYQYVERANREVRDAFDRICSETDFDSEASGWDHIRDALESGLITDPKEHLYFVASFNPEPTKAEQVGASDGG
jgi:hypothetical protein